MNDVEKETGRMTGSGREAEWTEADRERGEKKIEGRQE